MSSIVDTPADKLIQEVAKDLRENQGMEKPEWATYVKTGVSRERQPDDPNWWFIRAASMLRKISIDGPIGVERLRKEYGSKKNMGRRPEHFRKAGGKIIRHILLDLDSKGLTEISKKGRKTTPKGQSYLAKMSAKAIKNE